jgi:hypothetical protein
MQKPEAKKAQQTEKRKKKEVDCSSLGWKGYIARSGPTAGKSGN